jgi:P-type E1-E2 ATPase
VPLVAASESCDPRAAIATTVYFAKDGCRAKALLLGDKLKEDAAQAIEALAGTRRVLVSGDAAKSVATVAALCGFDSFRAELLPLEKQQYVAELKAAGHIVALVGDGINDAAALSSCHVSISVMSAADVAAQVSDILLTKEGLEILPKMRKLAQKGRRILRQNLFWAFFYNAIGIALAACGLLSPLFAAFAMTISSLMVLFNAMRLRS